jgi:hypothetical protein
VWRFCLAFLPTCAVPRRRRTEEATMATLGRRDRRRAEQRLDPVRWRQPGHGALIRLSAVAALLVTAAAVIWARPQTCAPAVVSPPHPAPAGTSRAATRPSAPAGAERPRAVAGTEVPRDSVGVPVRLAEPTALTLVHPGDRVDLLRVDGTGGTTSVAAAALVLGVTNADDPTAGGLLLALKPAEAQKAVALPGHGFAILIRPD